MNKKKIETFLFCTIFAISSITFVGCSQKLSQHSDYEYFNDDKSLISNSDVIISGIILKVNKAEKININTDSIVRSKNNEQDLQTYTVSEVKVSEVLKGDVKIGDTLKIKQLGDKDGIVEDSIIKNGGYFKNNSEHIFFLKSYKNIVSGMPYSVLNPSQGDVELVNNSIKVHPENILYKNGTSKNEFIKILKGKINSNK